MKKYFLIMLFLCLGGMVMAQDINYRQTIRGIVLDEQSGNVLSNVTVTIEGLPPLLLSLIQLVPLNYRVCLLDGRPL